MCYGLCILLGFLDTNLCVVKGKGQAHTDLLKLRDLEMMLSLFNGIDPAKERYLKGQGVDQIQLFLDHDSSCGGFRRVIAEGRLWVTYEFV